MRTEGTMRATTGTAAVMRRYYEKRRAPVPATKAREDVFTLLEERKAIRRTAEALLMRAIPYSGDPALKEAIDEMRALLEGRSAER